MIRSNKITCAMAAMLAVMIFIFLSLTGGGVGVTYAAASSVTAFEQSDVMDDLKTATINGKAFNIMNYPYDSTGVIKHPEIMTVVEYCYSARASQRGNYGVYIYFYNPQALNISTASAANKIALGITYSEDNDGNVKVDDYEKFNLQFCSKSTGDYRDLFYKFKVIDHKSTADGKTVAERVNSNARRYDISEAELLTVGNKNATAYEVGGSYIFTGYAAGYGIDQTAESTLACERRDLETVTLDLAGVTDGVDKRTYWRSNSSSLGAHHQNQINSVFFAIDKTVLEKFGYTLQRIKAEWWEYKTRPAIVIDDLSVYNALSAWCGVKISEDYDRNRGWIMKNSDYSYISGAVGGVSTYDWSWNAQLGTGVSSYFSNDIETILPLLFYTNGIDINDYVLLPDTLQHYFETYDKSYEKGHLSFNAKDFSADLFDDGVDEGRTRGYNLREFDISNPDDLWDIHSYDDTHSWWNKLWDYGFGSITTDDTYLDIPPIQMITPQDMAVSDLATHLKINSDDVDTLRDYFNESVKDKNHDGKPDHEVFLFRYAQTDYWAEDLTVTEISSDKEYNAEIRQGTQFFDFDILTMTFNRDGDLTTLGCVSSPVDHWSGYTPSIEPTDPDWWKWVKLALGILAAIVIFVVLYPIVKGVLWLLAAPFKLIAKLFKKKE